MSISDKIFKVNELGVITVDTQDIKNALTDAYKSVFGSDIKTSITDPVGQLIACDTELLEYAQSQIVKMANNFNIYYATGSALDGLGNFFGFYRKGSLKTIINCTINGVPSTHLSAGLQIGDGVNTYELLDDVIIGDNSSAIATFACIKSGSISAPKNTVNKILTPVSGWDSVNNLNDGIIGRDCEDDETFRKRITDNFLNVRATSSIESIVDNIASLPNVVDVKALSNETDTQKIEQGVTLPPHSICLIIAGGKGGQIAEVLTKLKSIGSNCVGNTDVYHFDDKTGYNYKYSIYRAAILPLFLRIEWIKNNFTNNDTPEQLKAFVHEIIQNKHYKIGSTVSGVEFGEKLQNFKYADVVSVKIKKSGSYFDYVKAKITELPNIEDIELNIIE